MIEITCPSGLAGVVRGLKVSEERILADRKLAKSGLVVDRLLQACWVETTDPGIYDFGTGAPDWSQVLQGDRLFALLRIRAATYGPKFDFAFSCEGCGQKNDHRIDLIEDLPVVTLSDEDRQTYLAGNRFRAQVGGHSIVFRLLTGADEQRIQKLTRTNRDSPLSTALGFRIVSVDGVDGDLGRWVRDLPMADASALIDAFDEHDCGVETDIEVECSACEMEQDIKLPFDRGFWMPSKAKARKQRSLN